VSELERYLDQLGRAHGFDRAHLEANRRGVLHPAQLERSQRGARSGPIVWALFVTTLLVGGLGGAYAFVDGSSEPLSRVDRNALIAILGATTVATLGFAWLGVRSARRAARRRALFRTSGVVTIEGPVSKGSVRGSASTYWLDLGGQRFFVTRRTWELVTHGAGYRGYLVAGELLTFEPAP
jgi:hypothetical protein